jgi:ectoine hydroxylase-related dioxygenase (phytanoyl-CoA dioxygenase family)
LARGVFSKTEIEGLSADFDHIVQQIADSGESANARWGGAEMKRIDGGDSVIIHTHNVQCYSANWLRAVQQQRFLDITEAILGPDIVLHHTKLFQKPPEKGSPFPMHQDWTYFPTENDTMMAGIVHVSQATDEMGCLRVYPGSHKLGRVEGTAGSDFSELLERYPIEGATILEAEPGDVLFFHYFLLHGSMPNRSPLTRKTVLVQMLAGSDAIEPRAKGHTHVQLTLRGWNHNMVRSEANSI